MTLEELRAIDRYWDRVSRECTALAERFAEGFADGEAKGFAEGKEEGIVEIAKNMKDTNISIESITKLTGLTEEDISRL